MCYTTAALIAMKSAVLCTNKSHISETGCISKYILHLPSFSLSRPRLDKFHATRHEDRYFLSLNRLVCATRLFAMLKNRIKGTVI